MNKIKEQIIDEFKTSSEIALACGSMLVEKIEKATNMILNSLNNNKKLMLCGNGGSATDALHFSAELMVRFEKERRALPSIALTSDIAVLTAIGNDYSYDKIFSRQIDALGRDGDQLIVLTTSGNSKNILEAVRSAKKIGNIDVIAFTGRNGGSLASKLGNKDIELRVPSNDTARIQEAHAIIIHCICRIIDQEFTRNVTYDN